MSEEVLGMDQTTSKRALYPHHPYLPPRGYPMSSTGASNLRIHPVDRLWTRHGVKACMIARPDPVVMQGWSHLLEPNCPRNAECLVSFDCNRCEIGISAFTDNQHRLASTTLDVQLASDAHSYSLELQGKNCRCMPARETLNDLAEVHTSGT